MANELKIYQEDSETLYRLLRQSIQVTTTVARPEYPMTAYLLQVALAALEDEMQAAIKATAEIEMRYS